MKKDSLLTLIIIVFAISWIGVLPSLLMSHGFDIPAIMKLLDIFMTLGPILGASIFLYITEGTQGLKDLFKRLLYLKAGPFVLFIALLSPILLSFLASYIGHELAGSSWPEAFNAQAIMREGIMVFVVYLIINTEEIAWRGLVFDRLLIKYGFWKACLILAPIWWLFHLPLFLYAGGHPGGYGLAPFTFMVATQTIILGWIYVKTQRSLFYVHMHHQLNNGFAQAFPIFPALIGGSFYPFWTLCSLMLLLAVGLFFSMRIHLKNQE